MTTFEAVIWAIVEGFTRFFPVSSTAHQQILSEVLHWSLPNSAAMGALALGGLLALLIYFIHDWLSFFSSFLKVTLLWRKPMSLDERMPFFLMIASAPMLGFWYFVETQFNFREIPISWILVSLAFFSFPFILGDRLNRGTKNMLSWNWFDALVVGLTQLLIFIPGAGRELGALTGSLLRNYTRDAAAKFSFFTLMPVLLAQSLFYLRDVQWKMPQPADGMTWMTFGVLTTVTLGSSLLAMGAFMHGFAQRGVRSYVLYRWVIAAGIGALLLFR